MTLIEIEILNDGVVILIGSALVGKEIWNVWGSVIVNVNSFFCGMHF